MSASPIDDPEIRRILEGLPLPPEERRELVTRMEMYRGSFHSPLPPPHVLEGYEQIVQGGADRLLTQVEKQAAHRQGIETKVIDGDLARSKDGQRMGFVVALAFLFVSAGLIFTGHETAGTVLGTVDLVALVTVFVVGRSDQISKSRGRRADESS